MNPIQKNAITSLDNNPLFKELLIQYCMVQYEEEAILTDESLVKEYIYLRNEGKIHELFECEMLTNYFEN